MTKTILQIIPALGTGGAEQACVDIAVGLCDRGDRALVVSYGGRRVQEVEATGARHFLHNVKSKNPLKIIANAFWLAKLIHDEHVDVVHVRSRAPAWSASMACAMTGKPLVSTFHAAYKYSNKIKKAYNQIMARADRVVAISDFIAEHIRASYQVGADRLRVIGRGIDLKQFDPEAVSQARQTALLKAWGVEEGTEIVLLPARLSPIKGQAMFIQAMELLRAKLGEDLPLTVIVGDDQGRTAYSQSLRDQITTAELNDKIIMVGACADMPAAYSLASLVVVPSKVPEGFGRVPVEAMAMGVPVIASALGATCETVEEGKTGWLLSPKDPGAWAEAVEKALRLTPEARAEMAVRARQRVERLFSREAMVAKTLAVYDELTAVASNGSTLREKA